MVKRGQELVTKAVEGLGGAAKLDQLRSLQKTDVRGNQVKNILTLALPDSLRQETVRPNFTLAAVITPSESFVQVDKNVRPMQEDNRTAVYKELHHDLVVLFRARTQPDFKAWAGSGGNLEVELPWFTATLGIDATTGRVLSQSYRGRGPGGVLGQIVINYSDYRTVEGLSLPFKTMATFNGEPFPALSATIETMAINGAIDASVFKKPQ